MEDNFYEDTNRNSNTGDTPNFVLYLVLSILELFLCNQITGILGIVFSCMANSDYKNNNYSGYELNMKRAKTSLTVGLVLGILAVLLVVCYMFFVASMFA